MTSTLVTVPTFNGWIRAEVAEVLVRLGRQADVAVVEGGPSLEDNLHKIIIERVLAGSYTHWLTIDADNPPNRNPLDLVDLDKDVIGCPTPVWHFVDKPGDRPWCLNAWDEANEEAFREHHPMNGLQQVDAVGTGCMLIARRVLEHPEMTYRPFGRSYDWSGLVVNGNDMQFCRRARGAGFTVWAHYDYTCRHFNTLDVGIVARAYGRMTE